MRKILYIVILYCGAMVELWTGDKVLIDWFEGSFIRVPTPLSYSPLNLLDGRLDTAIALHKDYNPLFEKQLMFIISFRSPSFKVDKMVIFNGYQKNEEIYRKNKRVREVNISFRKKRNDEKVYDIVLFTNLLLKDEKQITLILPKSVEIDEIGFYILSTYPGTTYDDTCISEIEFWYRGQKYEVANLEEAKREFVRKRKERVLKILLGGPERREGYSFNWMCGLSYITFTRTVKERGEFFIQACVDSRGAFVTNWEQAPDGAEMIITNIRGEWRFDEEGIFWTRVKGKDWKATDVSYIGENDLGRQGVIYFRGSDIETGYFNWSGPDSDAGP
ncbi:hypothetical protein BREVNS_0684 [Brevinematales bacterium NS]|nr:hypothetical protein BREVNS_0684 [Brevinematales bacterium NS]